MLLTADKYPYLISLTFFTNITR